MAAADLESRLLASQVNACIMALPLGVTVELGGPRAKSVFQDSPPHQGSEAPQQVGGRAGGGSVLERCGRSRDPRGRERGLGGRQGWGSLLSQLSHGPHVFSSSVASVIHASLEKARAQLADSPMAGGGPTGPESSNRLRQQPLSMEPGD